MQRPEKTSHGARWRLLLLLFAIPLAACAAEPAPDGAGAVQAGDSTGPYTTGQPSRDGIGKFYLGREISFVMGHRAAGWLERPEREREERTDLLINALPLAPDHVVADIGAGTGYFSFRIAERVPQGKVLAVDIQPEMLEIIEARRARGDGDNV